MKPGSIWPFIIAGALALHVAAMMAMVALATSNDSYAVEPDYYQKALAWDEKRAQDSRNAELGWRLEFTVEPASPGGDPILRATLIDATEGSIDAASITVEAFANARRNDILIATLSGSDGGYETTMPMRRDGLWEFRFKVTRGDDLFTYANTRHVWTELPE